MSNSAFGGRPSDGSLLSVPDSEASTDGSANNRSPARTSKESLQHVDTPSPTGVDNLDTLLFEILATHRSETWATGWNNKATKNAKAQLTSLINQIVRKELEDLPKNKLRDYINEEGQRKDIAIVNYRFIEERIEFYRGKSNE